jgi:catechol 2,3-dioxygenase-like lactoylglutathione lyase family enzyme
MSIRLLNGGVLQVRGITMPDLPRSNPEQFIQGAPVLAVPDVKSTAAYYRDVLGFHWDFGDENYSVVWRDNSAVHLVKADTAPSGIRLFQWVQDVDALFRELQDRGVQVDSPPEDQSYGLREFRMKDPNGIELIFSQDID